MTLSPAKRHMMRIQAAEEAASAADSNLRPNASQYELMQAQLYEDTRRLKGIESMKKRAEIKLELLDAYAPYVTGVLESDAGASDDVLMTVMLWRIDAGDYIGALDIGDYALRHSLTMPDKFQRSTACLMAEEFADAALKGAEVPAETLCCIEQLTASKDMPDQVVAKLHKALGTVLMESDPATALLHLQSALANNDNCGVKTMIKKLQKQLSADQPD